MTNSLSILSKIKKSVLASQPGATLILFGSYSRGDFNADSDIDILVLVDKESVTRDDEKKIVYSLFDIELETGVVISPIVYPGKTWETKYKITPLYKNIEIEGRHL